ncbi:MAG: hypothetical protein ACP5GD_02985 [Candidatus Micrarchaeia archaeon]
MQKALQKGGPMLPSSVLSVTALTGIADGIADPCGISVLLFLIAYMIELNSKGKIIGYGLFYSFVIGLIYFLFMVGLFKTMALIPYVQAIKIAVATILTVWGVLELKDFFASGKGPSMEMPHSVKVRAGMLIEKATLPAVILLGILVALGDIPCASGFTLFYTSYLVSNGIKGAMAISLLVLYNFFMVLPLIIITLALYFGMGKVETVRRSGGRIKQYLHLITGILFILIAILTLLW